jgi:hypothetical protein
VDDAVPVRDLRRGDRRAHQRHEGDAERGEDLQAHASPSIEWHALVISPEFSR